MGGCVQDGITQMGHPVFHTLEFVNDGKNMVRNVTLHYGSVTLPSGTAHQEYFPNHVPAWSESHAYPVPTSMMLHWTSDNGTPHDAVLPAESVVREVQHFAGFKISFVDSYVDLYVINRKSPMENESVKVFSSK